MQLTLGVGEEQHLAMTGEHKGRFIVHITAANLQEPINSPKLTPAQALSINASNAEAADEVISAVPSQAAPPKTASKASKASKSSSKAPPPPPKISHPKNAPGKPLSSSQSGNAGEAAKESPTPGPPPTPPQQGPAGAGAGAGSAPPKGDAAG